MRPWELESSHARPGPGPGPGPGPATVPAPPVLVTNTPTSQLARLALTTPSRELRSHLRQSLDPSMADSPESSLSSHASSEFDEEFESDDNPQPGASSTPAYKRQKLLGELNSAPASPEHHDTPAADDEWDISSDTSGDIPNSPSNPHMTDDDPPHEQVSVCKWLNCEGGDFGDMDRLVKHIHVVHVGSRKKTYACEWEGCSRFGNNHASAYALKAHIRSHTKGKPFMCIVPECDKSFTRSDALAKHLRTVHDLEPLRPSDPIPRNHISLQAKPQRLKLVMNSKPQNGDPNASISGPSNLSVSPYNPTPQNPHAYPPDIATVMTPDELLMAPSAYFRLVRRQEHYTRQRTEALLEEYESTRKKHFKEWQQKELLIANVEEAELAAAVDNHVPIEEALKLKDAFLPENMLPIHGPQPWYRQPPVPEEGGDEVKGKGRMV